MVEKWKGKHAVVTGCASGIGASIFKEFVQNKIRVIGLDIHPENALKIIESIGATDTAAHVILCDVSNSDSVKSSFKKIEDRFGFLNILVNCAGIGR